ncbi:restriction endonuclease subunit S, partial [Bacteroides ovatus]
MDTKKLRQKILDLAIRGKLVPQDPNDEPASVLLERIKEEKERLIKEGKIKKSKKTVSSDTYHYENKYLPKGWTICSLDDLATFGGGKTPSMDNRKYWNNAKHLWITSKDMKFAHIADSLLKISDAALDQMTIYGKGTLLIVTRSGILRHTFPIAILDTEATVNQDVKAISCVLSHIHTYLYYVIKAQEQVILKDYHKDGTTVDSIDFDKFKKLIVPLPPLSEQYRIVEEIEHWFALIDQIEQGKTDLQTTIKQIKGKILDLAIHGKLVPQDPNDESAIELLKRINPDFTPCDNRHYTQLPNGW